MLSAITSLIKFENYRHWPAAIRKALSILSEIAKVLKDKHFLYSDS